MAPHPSSSHLPVSLLPPPTHDPEPSGPGRPHVLGHRGARGLLPENTLPSFAAALDAGVDGIELDVLVSADGVPVVWHDPVLLAEKLPAADATLAGTLVRSLDAARLGAIDVGAATLPEHPRQRPAPGASIRPLAEVLAFLLDHPSRPWVLLEIKADPRPDARLTETGPRTTAAALEVLARLAADGRGREGVHDRIVLESFDWSAVEEARRLDPDLVRAALAVGAGAGMEAPTVHPGSPWLGSVGMHEGEDVLDAVARLGVEAVAPHHGWVAGRPDPTGWVERAHDLGLAVVVWTVNEADDVRLMRDLGVDAVVSDVPDAALEVLR